LLRIIGESWSSTIHTAWDGVDEVWKGSGNEGCESEAVFDSALTFLKINKGVGKLKHSELNSILSSVQTI
jgi:hypothetical protein